jgi:hypothetical protein
MPDAENHHKAFRECITRATLIRKDLAKHPTEYFPEKVRGLLKAYFATIKETIKQGELYLDKTDDFELGLEVAVTIENYKALIIKLKR